VRSNPKVNLTKNDPGKLGVEEMLATQIKEKTCVQTASSMFSLLAVLTT
jgi:hypothetical protein